jgi:flagellar biosynthesis protein FliR
MPQIQIFTLAVPGQIALVMTLFMLTLGKIMFYFIEQFDELLTSIFK